MKKKTKNFAILSALAVLLILASVIPSWAVQTTQNITVLDGGNSIAFKAFNGDSEIAYWTFSGVAGQNDCEPTCFNADNGLIYTVDNGRQNANSGINEITIENIADATLEVFFYARDMSNGFSYEINVSTAETYYTAEDIHGNDVSGSITNAMVESSPASPQITDLTAGENQSLFLYFDIPQDAPPGSYNFNADFFADCIVS